MINTLTSFSIVLREGLEALLLLIMFNKAAVTPDQRRFIISGALGGIAVPMAAATFATTWTEINEHTLAIVGNLAAGTVLAYVFFWSRQILTHVREHVDAMVTMTGIAVMISSWFIVARESTELALMLFGSYTQDPIGTLNGVVLGTVVLVALSLVFAQVLKKINIARFFQISSVLFGVMSLYYFWEGIEKIIDILQ